MSAFKLAIFASGNGTNAEAIMQHFKNHPQISVVLLVSNNASAYALERAKKFGVPGVVISRSGLTEADFPEALKNNGVTHLVLAGFLLLIPEPLIRHFDGKVINIHPALLPKYGGKGMYGHRVHEAVLAAGEKESGISIHEVNGRYDEGTILFQARCAVAPKDTPSALATRIHELEHEHYPTVIEQWVLGQAITGKTQVR